VHYTQQIRELARREQQRHIDMAVLLRRAKTGETILCAGGVWDQLDQDYRTNRQLGSRIEPETARVFDLNEAQVPLARWYAGELAAFRQGFRRRERMALAIGDRRSGKTVGTCALAVATNIDVPKIGWHGLITWVVGVARPEMQELDRYLTWMMPAAWYRESLQEHAYNLINTSQIMTISADNPRTLKRGEANVVLLNEGQKMPVLVLSNAIMGTVDNDGVLLIAANPPEEKKGEWVWAIKRGVKDGTIPATAVFELNSRDNAFVDQHARSEAMSILQVLDPDMARIDGGGECLLQEGKALPFFDINIHRRPRPQVGLVPITGLLTQRLMGRAYRSVIGLDFQTRPYMPAMEIEAYGTHRLRQYLEGRLDRSQVDLDGDDQPLYWIVNEAYAANGGTEHELADAMWIAGMRPDSSYCVGDASGAWQNAQHQIGDDSFTIMRSRRWVVVPPFEAKTDRGSRPANPKIRYRVNLARTLCGLPPEEAERRRVSVRKPRFFIDPRCERAIKIFADCELKPSSYNGELKPYGFASHGYDAGTYVLCHLEPRPEDHTRPEFPEQLESVLDQLRKQRNG
jgi:hypothetical protein